MGCPNKQWTLQYDDIVGQYYYVNNYDNSILFDLPCEVHYTPDQKKTKLSLSFRNKATSGPCVRTASMVSSASSASRKRSILSRLGSALSRLQSRLPKNLAQNLLTNLPDVLADKLPASIHSTQLLPQTPSQISLNSDSAAVISASPSAPSAETFAATRIDDEYLLYNPANARNFAGTAGNYDSDEESISSESINTYYSELQNDDFYYEYPESVSSLRAFDYEKEKDREELRLQFMHELEL